jgi:hypothetical protein
MQRAAKAIMQQSQFSSVPNAFVGVQIRIHLW